MPEARPGLGQRAAKLQVECWPTTGPQGGPVMVILSPGPWPGGAAAVAHLGQCHDGSCQLSSANATQVPGDSPLAQVGHLGEGAELKERGIYTRHLTY